MTHKQPTISIAILGGATLLSLLVLAGWLANLDQSFLDSVQGAAKTIIMMVAGLLTSVVCILGLFGLLRQFHRWYPVDRAYELTYTQSDWQDFQRHSWISALVYLGLAVLFSFFSYQALLLLAGTYARLIQARFFIPVAQDFWLIPAIFFALFCAILVSYQVYRWLMKERFPRFMAFHNQRFGFDQRKAGLTMVIFGLLFSLGLVIIGLNLYLRIDGDSLAINRFFGLIENRYSYDEIVLLEERILTHPGDSEMIQDHSYVLQFKDGRQWRSSSYGSRPVPPNILEALTYIAQKSGLPLNQVITKPN